MTTPAATAASTTLGAAAASGETEPKGAGADVKVETKPDETKPDAKLEAEKAAALELAKPFTDIKQLKLTDGFALDEKLMGEFLPIAKEHGLTAKQAQALVEFDSRRAQAFEASREATAKAAGELLRKDPDIGGAKFEQSMQLAAKALHYIGSPELNKALNEARLEDGTPLGDWPVLAKILVNLGGKVREDTTKGTHSNGAAKKEKTLVEALYGPGTIQAGPQP